jgi:hypothetical protein
MPRFFLHLHDCGTLVPDEEGREFRALRPRSRGRHLRRANYSPLKLPKGNYVSGARSRWLRKARVERSSFRSAPPCTWKVPSS